MGRHPEIARTIKQARKRRGLSQEAAAKAVGTSRFHWIRWEQGLHRPLQFAPALAAVLGVDEKELGCDDDEEDDELARVLLGALTEVVALVEARKGTRV